MMGGRSASVLGLAWALLLVGCARTVYLEEPTRAAPPPPVSPGQVPAEVSVPPPTGGDRPAATSGERAISDAEAQDVWGRALASFRQVPGHDAVRIAVVYGVDLEEDRGDWRVAERTVRIVQEKGERSDSSASYEFVEQHVGGDATVEPCEGPSSLQWQTVLTEGGLAPVDPAYVRRVVAADRQQWIEGRDLQMAALLQYSDYLLVVDCRDEPDQELGYRIMARLLDSRLGRVVATTSTGKWGHDLVRESVITTAGAAGYEKVTTRARATDDAVVHLLCSDLLNGLSDVLGAGQGRR
jgi:hypothetical protein